MQISHYVFLCSMAFIAGTIDTISGGGGLITVPSLLLAGFDPVTALGTNKLQAAITEITASYQFLRRRELPIEQLGMGVLFTFIGSSIGTIILQFIPGKYLDHIVPCLLALVFIYYLFPKSKFKHRQEAMPKFKFYMYFGLIVGFYNGFFGPATGSIWAILISSCLLLPIYQSIMLAKPLNFIGNLSALLWFLLGGKVDFTIAFIMGIGSLSGALVGARFVQARNNQYLQWGIRIMLLISILPTFYEIIANRN